MKAIIMEQYGGPEQLIQQEIPIPRIGEHEVLIEVYSIAINPAEWKTRAGYLKDIMPLEFPHILGYDVAGVISEVGAKVTKWKKGESVFTTANGGYAEFAIADEKQVVEKPANITFNEAASVITTSMTAWTALFIDGKLTKGQKVLIHGGAGGVGSMAIQLAKKTGVFVAATASTSNINFIEKLGADEVIDYTKQDFTEAIHDYDLVVDLVGNETQERSYQVLKKDGILASAVGIIDDYKVDGIQTASVWVQPSGELLKEIAKLLENGVLTPVIREVLPFDEKSFRRAHEILQTGHIRGKIVIQVKE